MKRIQRKRTKGWEAPEGAVYVGRPSKWGNPFSVLPHITPGTRVGGGMGYFAVATLDDAIECFKEMFIAKPSLLVEVVAELNGKDLMCWCPLDQPCHADVLLEIANAPEVRP